MQNVGGILSSELRSKYFENLWENVSLAPRVVNWHKCARARAQYGVNSRSRGFANNINFAHFQSTLAQLVTP
jgi:hypothetical protein